MTSLIQQWRDAKQVEQDANKLRREIELKLLADFNDEIIPQLDADYKTGTAKLDDGKYVMVLNYLKKVSWNNANLEIIYQNIIAAGENPKEYIESSYTVAESKYKAWPEHIQKSFTPSRTVKAGNPTFTIKESK